jgi:hypothetical protein
MFKIVPIPALLLLLQACSSPDSTPLPTQDAGATNSLLSRLPGAWIHQDDSAGYIFEEYWSVKANGDLEGLGVVRSGKDTVMIEELAIMIRDTATWYSARIASQNAGMPVLFELVLDGDSLIFSNPRHDFPQRITYIPTDDGHWTVHLNGEAEGRARDEHLHFKPHQGKTH